MIAGVIRIDIHREALKERQTLPAPVFHAFAEIEEAIATNPYAPELVRKREAGWGRRTILVAEANHAGTHYRLAWEVVSAADVFIWQYGVHEGFYRKLARRARQ